MPGPALPREPAMFLSAWPGPSATRLRCSFRHHSRCRSTGFRRRCRHPVPSHDLKCSGRSARPHGSPRNRWKTRCLLRHAPARFLHRRRRQAGMLQDGHARLANELNTVLLRPSPEGVDDLGFRTSAQLQKLPASQIDGRCGYGVQRDVGLVRRNRDSPPW